VTANEKLGSLLEAFVNEISHPRGRALSFLAKSSITVAQAILLNHALKEPGSTPTSLAAKMNLSLPSVSQMIDRLVNLGLVLRVENRADRRQKTIDVTAKAKKLLREFRVVRSQEYSAGTASLLPATQRQLVALLGRALNELRSAEASSGRVET
jgi:DNA-binding MarR family transcriptional regulator